MGVGSFRVATIGSVSFLTDRLNAELLVKAGYRSAWSAAQFAGAAYHAASVEEAGWTALWGERRGRAPLPPPTPRPPRWSLQGWKLDGRDAALYAARREAREPGPEGRRPWSSLASIPDSLAKSRPDNYSLTERRIRRVSCARPRPIPQRRSAP